MENFDIDNDIKLAMRTMQFMGVWPTEHASRAYKITGCTTILLVTALALTTTIQALRFVNIESTSFALCCTFACSNTVVKYFFLFVKKSEFLQLLDLLKTPIFAVHEKHVYIFLKNTMKMCKRCLVIQTINAVTAGIFITASALVEGKSERPIPIPFPSDMKEQPLVVYGSVWCFQIVTIFLIAFSAASFDGLIFTFIGIASAQIRILREQISHATDCYACDPPIGNTEENDVKVNNLLKQCIIKHLSIEEYITLIQKTFTNGFLVQVLVSLCVTCLMGFSMVLVPVTSIDFVRSVFFFMGAVTELIMFCSPANEVILQSEKIRDACYMSEWVNCGPSVRKTLFIIMERSKRPFSLNAAGFMVLSLDALLRIFKSAYSYFTVLHRMYGNPSKN